MIVNIPRRGDPCGRPSGRKSLRLKNYNYSEQGAYFITVCSKNRKFVFLTEEIRNAILYEMNDLEKRFGILLNCGVVSMDHVHMLLSFETKKDVTISHVLSAFKSLSYHKVRAIIRDSSPLWQRGFYDHIIRNEKDWVEKAGYIESHPVKEELLGLPPNSVLLKWH